LFHLYPPVTEKATVALYFGRIRTRLGVVHFRAKDATTCKIMVGVEPRSRDRDHTVAIKMALELSCLRWRVSGTHCHISVSILLRHQCHPV